MSRWEALSKLLGLAAEDVAKLSPEVVNTLEKVNTPEISTALKGAEREQYLKALTEAYGDQNTRAKNMGFGDKTWYHGSSHPEQIDEFKPSKAGGMTGKFGSGVYVAEHPAMTDQYTYSTKVDGLNGPTYPLKIKNKDQFLPHNLEEAIEIVQKEKALGNEGKALKGQGPYGMLRSTEEGQHLLEKKFGIDQISELLDKNNKRMVIPSEPGADIAVVKPNEIRSINAAFDPRFKDSAKLIAGVGAMPAASQMDLGNTISNFSEDVVEPVVSRYEKLKSMLTEPLAKQLDLTKDKSVTEGLKTGLDIGLDPTNLLGGIPGIAAAGAQILGQKKDKK